LCHILGIGRSVDDCTKIYQEPIEEDFPKEVPPAYFQSLVISGVKCFRQEVLLSFLRPDGRVAQWTVILGENGVGKTTVLECLAGLSVMPRRDRAKEMRPVVLPLMASTIFSRADLPHRSNRDSGKWAAACTSKVAVGDLLAGAGASASETVGWHWATKKEESDPQKIHIEIGDPTVLGGLRCYGYGAGRRMATTSRLPYANSPEDMTRTLTGDDQPLINAEEWLLELDHLAEKEGRSKETWAEQQLNSIKELLIKVLPDVNDIRIVVKDGDSIPESTVRAEFKTSFGWVTVDQLSFGYQTIVSWLVDLTRRLYQRYPRSSNPLAEPAIVLIDEIDLHLHPRWQQSVMDYLSERFTNTQFIVSAHSPLIVQSNEAANLILLQREGDHVVARQDLDSVKEWRVDQILTSDLFGLDRTRRPEIERLYDERSGLLAQTELTPQDRARIEELNRAIHELPTAETKEMREVESLLRSVASEHQVKK